MLTKQIIFPGRDERGNVLCQPILGEASAYLEKTASVTFKPSNLHPAIQRSIKDGTISKSDKGIYVLVSALGAAEYWGSNVNGDSFPLASLINSPSDWIDKSLEEMRKIGKDWRYGYPTFMNAYPYKHHANKDPSRAFGHVVLSVWNPKMFRVELVVFLDKKKCEEFGAQDVYQRIENGEFPDVSMGCFTAGTLITMSDGTRKPIENIAVGDEVITHLGRARKVTELHRRKYTGSLYTIKAEGHRAIQATRNHPWLFAHEADVKEKDSHSNLKWKNTEIKTERWADSECLDDTSYLLEPKFQWDDQITPFVVQPNKAAARLLGYYLAEGHLLRNKKGELSGIELTTHKDDYIHSEIDNLCKEFGTRNTPVTFERVNSENSLGIWIFDAELAEFCHKNAGQYSKEKKLSKDVISWKPIWQRELLGAYANGDGHGPIDGSLKLSTSSEGLAHQWLLILPRLGIIPSLGTLYHKAGSGKSKINTIEYVVHIGKQEAQELQDVCAKIHKVEIEKSKNSRKILGDYIVTPIRDIDAIYVETDVYNFEVEEDNSYLVEGLAVHNCKVPYDRCSICDHKSKTQKDYCFHAKYEMNKIYSDGRKVCVINDFPRFFDISFVFIGADKSAKMLAKLAQVNDMICMGDYCAVPRLSADIGEKYAYAISPQEELQEFFKEANQYIKIANDPIKEKIEVAGVPVWLEWKSGETREYKRKGGQVSFSKLMKHHYGYIPNTKDADGEEIDVYVGPNRSSKTAWIIKQLKKDGSFDENKVMMGFGSKNDAKASYDHHMGGADDRFGGIKEVPVSALRALFGDNSGKDKTAASCSCDCGGVCSMEIDKVAEGFGQKSASHAKLSEITKIIPAGPFRTAMLPKLEKSEGELPKKTLEEMAKHGMPAAISTSASLGIVLKPEEFQYLVLTKIGEDKLANFLHESGSIFEQTVKVDDTFAVYDPKDVVEKLAEHLLPFVPGRSIASSLLEKRASIALRLGEMGRTLRPANGELLDKIAELYNGYRQGLVKKAALIDRSMIFNPHLSSTLSGESLVMAFAGGKMKTAHASVFGPESLAYLIGAHYENREFHIEALTQSGVLAAA